MWYAYLPVRLRYEIGTLATAGMFSLLPYCSDTRETLPCGESGVETAEGCRTVGANPDELPGWAISPACGESEIPAPDGSCVVPGPEPCAEGVSLSGHSGIRLVDPSGSLASALGDTTVLSRHLGVQEAVDAASAGETVLIGSGEFKENIRIDKSIRLMGGCGVSPVLRAADSGQAAITVASGRLEIDRLTIEWGRPGLRIDAGASAGVRNSVFSDNSSYGIDSEGSLSLTKSWVRGTVITSEDPYYEGGARAVRVVNQSEPVDAVIERNRIEGVYGDGIYLVTSTATVRENLITGFTDCCKPAGVTSAGIWIARTAEAAQGAVLIENNYLKNNRIWTGIGVRRDGPVAIRNNLIVSLGTAVDRETVAYTDANESFGLKIKYGTPVIEGNYVSDVAGRAMMLTTQGAGETLIASNYMERCDSHCLYAFGPGATYALRGNSIVKAGRPSSMGLLDVSGGMWLAFGTFNLERNTVADSYLVGIGVLNSTVTLEDNLIRGIRKGVFDLGGGGVKAETGDGFATLFETRLTGVRNLLTGNERGGMLLDTAGVLGIPKVQGVKASLSENTFVGNREFAIFVQNGATAEIGSDVAGVRNVIRESTIGIGATTDSREGVRLIGPDAGVRLTVREHAVDAVRLSVQDFESGIRLAPRR